MKCLKIILTMSVMTLPVFGANLNLKCPGPVIDGVASDARVVFGTSSMNYSVPITVNGTSCTAVAEYTFAPTRAAHGSLQVNSTLNQVSGCFPTMNVSKTEQIRLRRLSRSEISLQLGSGPAKTCQVQR